MILQNPDNHNIIQSFIEGFEKVSKELKKNPQI
jgi:hypothetical protein